MRFPLHGFLLTLSLSFLLSCQPDEILDEPKVNPVVRNNRYVNEWILDNMKDWYLWDNYLPVDVNTEQAPEDYFTSLLYEGDRFSWLQPDYQELLNSLQGVNEEAGFEYVLYRENADGENVVAQVLYVKPQSPASVAGLKRGDVISKINGQSITTANYRDIIQELKVDHSVVYKPLIIDSKSFGAETSLHLSAVQYTENPNFLFKILKEGDRRIGYYVYNFFASGSTADSEDYDSEMDQIFSVFKQEGITDLVLDLRFNSGGSEVSAKNLASLIGPGVNNSKLFFRRIYNSKVMSQINNDPDRDEYLKSFFSNESANIGSQLTNNRVYILTSSRTASASELIINGLRPYMEVFLIGDLTYGKNVGSISLFEEDDAENKWGLQPIVVKVSNSSGFSDYGDGFTPDIENKDNSLYLYPLGDPRENLLAEAIAHIQGVTLPGRTRALGVNREVLGHSLDEKRRGFNLMVETPKGR